MERRYAADSDTRTIVEPTEQPQEERSTGIAARRSSSEVARQSHGELALFRPEALAERDSQWMGTVLLAPKVPYRFFAWFALITILAVLALLIFAHYTRSERVSGLLVPQQGIMRVSAPQAGVVSELHVKEGQKVAAGQKLIAVSSELESETLGSTQKQIASSLAKRRQSLSDERRQQKMLLDQQMRAYSDRLAGMSSEIAQIEREIQVQQSRVAFGQKSEGRLQDLRERGYVSEQQFQQTQEATLEQLARLRLLERNRMTVARERATVQAEMRDLPLKFEAQFGNIDRTIAGMGQELAETEARRAFVITAPHDGVVTAIQIERGSRVNANAPLLSVVPPDSVLEAHLYSPGRAIGFIRPGQKVLLRYRAYPYQKFGHYAGTVTSIARSATSPAELPPQLAGVTSLVGANQNVYRLTVALDSQNVNVYDKAVPLQPGMELDAEILLERRRLIEWMFEPLFTVTRKWQ